MRYQSTFSDWARKSSVRCKVEHAFLIVKRDFGYRKVAYKGLKKNLNRFHMLFACANLLMLVRGGRTEQFCNAWPRGYCAQFRVRARKTGRKRGLKLGKKDLFWCNIRRILQKIRILGLADVLHAIVQRFLKRFPESGIRSEPVLKNKNARQIVWRFSDQSSGFIVGNMSIS